MLALAMCLGALVPSAVAQTAHSGGNIVTLLSGPSGLIGVAVDGSGNVFFGDRGNGAVKEILAAGGYATTITLASGFSNPLGLAVDANGNVYVADNNSNTGGVKEILAVGGVIPSSPTIRTLGSGISSPYGVAVDSNGNVFVADQYVNAIKEILAVGGTVPSSPTIQTLGSGFNQPSAVAVDASGNVVVADGGNHAVKEILATGGYTTVNTLGSGFSHPFGVALDSRGNIYVADFNTTAIKEIVAGGGYTTVLTLGSGFSSPAGVAVDPSGDIFVANYGDGTVKEVLSSGINFGSAPVATTTPVTTPLTFTFDTGGTILAPAVLTQGATGLDFTDAGTGTCTANGTSHTYQANDTCTINVTFTPKAPGIRYGAATLKNSSGTVIATAYLYGTGIGPQVTFSPPAVTTLGSGFSLPLGVAVDGSGNVFVADDVNNTVKEILAAGGYTTVNTLGSGFSSPTAVAIDGSGNVFVVDNGHSQIKEILKAGGYTTVNTLGSGFTYPFGIALDGSGNVFVAGHASGRVNEILASSGYTTVLTLGSGFGSPVGVAVDGSGNVFVSDIQLETVSEILAAGGYTTVKTVGSGFSDPIGMTFDPNGNLIVADSGHSALKTILAASGYTTVNTLATGFDYPYSVALGANGNLYVADAYNYAVKQLNYAGPPSLAFASTHVGATSSDSPKTATLVNSGNATLTFPPPGTGVNPSIATGFTLGNSSTCPQLSTMSSPATLAAGASCTNLLSFSPTVSGSISGSLTVTDNALNAVGPSYTTQSIALSGTATGTPPTITFTVPSHTYGDAPFTVSASSNSTGAFTYSVVSGPATIAGATVTLTGTGTVVLQASEASDSNYLAGSSNATFTVAAATPTITFAVPGHTFGDAPFTVSASSNSSGAFTYSVVSGPATVSGATVTLTGTGTVVLQASEAANGNYAAGTQTATFAVATATPTITFAVPGHTFGDAPFTVSASSNSSGAFTYTVVSGPATVSGATVTLTGAGTVVLQAAEASNGNYAVGTQNASFAVAAATPAITFSVPGHTFGDAPFTVSASSNSSAAFTYSVVSGPATVSGATVTLTGVGTVLLQAAEAASSNYLAGTQNATFAVAAGTPAIAFSVPAHTFGDAPFTLSASSNSSGAFTYSVISGPATTAGATVTLTGAGMVVVQAAQAASANYIAGTQNATFTVAPATPTIAFSVPGHTFGDAPFPITASSNSSGAFTYSVLSGPATISGATVTLTGAGTVVLQASEAASGNYAAGTQNATIAVAAGAPTIAFNVPAHTFGDAPFTISASSNSSGAFTYIVVSGPATIAGATVTLTGVGTVVLQASQATSGSYAAGTQNAVFAVAPGRPAIAFSVPSHIYGDAPFIVSATSNSTGAFLYTVVSGPATLSGATVTLTGAGTVVLQASEAASSNYIAGVSTTAFTVSPGIALSAGTTFNSPTETVPAGTAANFALTFTSVGGAAYPNPLLLSVSGLPAGATATFFPATVPAGSASASIFLIVQTSAQTVRNEKPSRTTPFAPLALAVLVLPLAGMKSVQRRLPSLMAVFLLFTGAVLCLSGCGSAGNRIAAKSYTLTVTATDTVTGAHSATNITLVLQ